MVHAPRPSAPHMVSPHTPSLERIEAGLAEEAANTILEKLDVYTAGFETEVAGEYVKRLASRNCIRTSRIT